MSILDLSKNERPNVATVTVKHSANEKIARDVDAFLASGGRINQIPTGQSGIQLKTKASKYQNGGTKYTWQDDRLALNSEEGKASTMRKRIARESEQQSRKKVSASVGRPRQARDERFDKAKKLLAEGKSQREVSRILGVARGTLRHWLDMDSEGVK